MTPTRTIASTDQAMNCRGLSVSSSRASAAIATCRCVLPSSAKVHRYEPSGALHGLMRVRAFTQDDAQAFITQEQTPPSRWHHALILDIYKDFGFDDGASSFQIAPRSAWVMSSLGSGRVRPERPRRTPPDRIQPERGEGAFYGPKLEVRAAGRHRPRLAVRHAPGRPNMPGRLGPLCGRTQPETDAVMLHRAILAAGTLFRHSCSSTTAGRLPCGSVPVQVVVMRLPQAVRSM